MLTPKRSGHSSPMGLAWTFMGYSKPYTFFAGLMEIIHALLLLFRKTTSMGALISVGVMTIVVVINFSYDIPVKLFSIHIVLFSLFLLAFDGKRILNFFLFNKSVPALDLKPVFTEKRNRNGALIFKVLFIASIIIPNTVNTWSWYQQLQDGPERVPLYANWEVEEFLENGNPVSPPVTDDERWQYLIFEQPDRAVLIRTGLDRDQLNTQVDTTDQTITLNLQDESTFFSFEKRDSVLVLTGEREDQPLTITLHAFDLENFRLIDRGFNWINEFPYNR